MVTTANIISFISDGTYPYPIRFVTGEQKFKVYPYCEVVETSPRAKTEDAETITESQSFEIRLYIRYIRTLDQETANLETIEAEILNQIHTESLESGELFSEEKRWSRTPIQDVYGVQSTLSLTWQDITPAETGTRIGAGATLALGGTTLKLIRGTTGTFGRNSDNIFNDIGTKYPIKGEKLGTRSFEYAWKSADYNAIQTLINTGTPITVTLTEGSITTNYTGLPTQQRDTQDYKGLKVVTLEVEVLT